MSLLPRYTAAEVAQAFKVTSDDVSFLGRGSFGETWKVASPTRVNACKIIDKSLVSAERLNREIDGLKRVNHPGVVKLYEHSDVEIGGESQHLLVFEYVHGGDMAKAIGDGRVPTSEEAHHLLVCLLEAVAALHAADVVHRDIKPANVALRDGKWGHPVVLDLGLAKPLDVSTLTAYPRRVGTLVYMSPEQLRGEKANKPSDLWSVGASFVEVVTGTTPFIRSGDHLLSEEEFVSRLLRRQEAREFMLPAMLDPVVVSVADQILAFKSYRRSRAERAVATLRGMGRQ